MSRIYVGNIPSSMRERDVDDICSRYGRIERIDIKNGFCMFVSALKWRAFEHFSLTLSISVVKTTHSTEYIVVSVPKTHAYTLFGTL